MRVADFRRSRSTRNLKRIAMPISDIPIFSMLRTKMHWHQERQRLLSENVANADTPKFAPRDLVPLNFDQTRAPVGSVTLARTNPGHFGDSSSSGSVTRSSAWRTSDSRSAVSRLTRRPSRARWQSFASAFRCQYRIGATLATERALPLTRAGLSPVGSDQFILTHPHKIACSRCRR